MALFSFKKKKPEAKRAEAPSPRTEEMSLSSSASSLEWVLKRPRVTEKATALEERNVYVFEIDSRAGKDAVTKAVLALYKVRPLKVRIVRLPAKRTGAAGRRGGHAAGLKKAYVYLPSGSTISLV